MELTNRNIKNKYVWRALSPQNNMSKHYIDMIKSNKFKSETNLYATNLKEGERNHFEIPLKFNVQSYSLSANNFN